MTKTENNTINVTADGKLAFADKVFRCALGKSGLISIEAKHEGDGATPQGTWALKRVYFRPDRVEPFKSALPIQALKEVDLWCDAPDHPNYNQPVTAPFDASHEELWRSDNVYDIVVVLGYNDDPVVPGKGSAIFFHLAHPDYAPTEGCVAVAQEDMLEILTRCGSQTRMQIT